MRIRSLVDQYLQSTLRGKEIWFLDPSTFRVTRGFVKEVDQEKLTIGSSNITLGWSHDFFFSKADLLADLELNTRLL